MLQNCNSNSSGRDIAKQMGEVEVKYGAQRRNLVDGSGSVTLLAFANPLHVGQPQQDLRFDA